MSVLTRSNRNSLPGAQGGRTRLQREWREWLLFVLLVGPNLALFAVFNYWPLIYNFYLSFVDWNFLREEILLVGFRNYVRVFSASKFYVILLNTLVFTVASCALTLSIGLLVAMLLNQKLRGRNLVRAVIFSPTILSGAAIAVVWAYIFDPRYGLLSEILGLVGLPSPNWLTSTEWAMPALIIVYVWKNMGYAVVIFLAGLQAISKDLYEAARVDGADGLARFIHITLPGLSPIAFFLTVTTILQSFQAFDIIRVMTGGGPANATNTLIYHLYELGFVSFNAGEAGVIAVVLFSLMLVLTILQVRYMDQQAHYNVRD
ncbi:MAG: sugar ABC transporter permease [Chloroflexaceae bacterium]|nr:sugar ABC transporter permease [Chloroflexaceae bacterium]NJO04199.1 sugar ABC transporter permease [Chloroflexaceae bacterium]